MIKLVLVMKITSDWFVDMGFLVSEGFWGERRLDVAGRYFHGKELRVFMTGDAHHKPFKWAARGSLTDYFRRYIIENRICCHVENFSNKVTIYSVPEAFRRVFSNNKVFGWEPEVFRSLNMLIKYAQTPQLIDKTMMGKLMRELQFVSTQGYMRDEYRAARRIWRENTRYILVDFYEVIKDTPNIAFAMRLDPRIQRAIGANIQRNINRYQDHIHLISCGAEHMKVFPLYNYVQPPAGCFGIADESSDKPIAVTQRPKPKTSFSQIFFKSIPYL